MGCSVLARWVPADDGMQRCRAVVYRGFVSSFLVSHNNDLEVLLVGFSRCGETVRVTRQRTVDEARWVRRERDRVAGTLRAVLNFSVDKYS